MIKKDVIEHSEVTGIEKIRCCLQGNILKWCSYPLSRYN